MSTEGPKSGRIRPRQRWLLLMLAIPLLALGCEMGPGSISAPQPGCTENCHNASVPPDPMTVSGTGSAGKHVVHDTAGLSCSTCHDGYEDRSTHTPLAPVHFDQTHQSGEWDGVNKTCANLSCHGGGTRTWAGGSGVDVPATPAGLAAGSPTSISLAVSWSASADAASYQVFRDTSAGGAFSTQVYTGSAWSLTDSPLASSTTYYYKVRATNAAGSSPLSAAASSRTSVATSAGCTTSCHNASVSPNPLPTGRHSRHVSSAGYACDKCHHDYQIQPTHNNGALQTAGFVLFDASNASAVWTDATRTCSSTSCHGSSGKVW